MQKKNWNNPELKNLDVKLTEEEFTCPDFEAVIDTFKPGNQSPFYCRHYCSNCGGCKKTPYSSGKCKKCYCGQATNPDLPNNEYPVPTFS